jgi:hypothetical protein
MADTNSYGYKPSPVGVYPSSGVESRKRDILNKKIGKPFFKPTPSPMPVKPIGDIGGTRPLPVPGQPKPMPMPSPMPPIRQPQPMPVQPIRPIEPITRPTPVLTPPIRQPQPMPVQPINGVKKQLLKNKLK